MDMVIAAAAATLFLTLLFLQWIWRRNPLPINWPFIGMTPSLLCNMSNLHDYATQILINGGGTFLCRGPWFTNFSFLITSDPTNLHHILSKNMAKYPKGRGFQEVFAALGDGIFNSDSDSWKLQRKLLHSVIGTSRFEQYTAKISWRKVETALFPVLDHVSRTGIEVDLQELFSHFTFDASCLLILGVDPSCLAVDFHQNPFEKAFDCIEMAAFYRNIFPPFLWKLQRRLGIGMEKERSKALRIIDQSIYHYIELRRKNLDQNSEESQFDILTVFTSGEEEKQYISSGFENPEKFLRDVAFNLLSAGRDTVGAALTWFFWFVAKNPSVEHKILEEMEANLGQKWRVLTVDELSKLVYLHGAICEALRLCPPVPFNRKVAAESDVLPSGHRIGANTTVVLSLFSVGRMAAIWGEDCLEFKPERWISDKGGIVHVPSYKFTAFNAGPRTCLGRDVSFITMKIVATSIIWNYRIECVDGHPVSPMNSVVLHMRYGLKVRVTKRNV